MNIAWEMTHSVETEASQDFVWAYWTDVTNWDDPPARFELDGPFAPGRRGTTYGPGQTPLRWLIRDVDPRNSATIELRLDGAVLSFEWRLEAVSLERTRLSQRVLLQGEKARNITRSGGVYLRGYSSRRHEEARRCDCRRSGRQQESKVNVVNYTSNATPENS